MWVHFVRHWNGNCWYILWPFGIFIGIWIFYGLLVCFMVIFFQFWCFVPRRIWQHWYTYICKHVSCLPWWRRGLHSGIVSACHRGDWSYGSWDRIPPGYGVVAFINKKASCFLRIIHFIRHFPNLFRKSIYWKQNKPWWDASSLKRSISHIKFAQELQEVSHRVRTFPPENKVLTWNAIPIFIMSNSLWNLIKSSNFYK
jgi:hypothetical protein